MYRDSFQDHFYEKLALSCFDVVTKSLYKCKKDRPFNATKNQDIFFQNKEGFSFARGRPSSEFNGLHMTIPNRTPSQTNTLH